MANPGIEHGVARVRDGQRTDVERAADGDPDLPDIDLEVPQCSHCGVSLLTRDQPEARLVVCADGCVLHWFCAYPAGAHPPESRPAPVPCPSSHEHVDVGW